MSKTKIWNSIKYFLIFTVPFESVGYYMYKDMLGSCVLATK